MGRADPTTHILKEYKESWTDKLMYKKMKLQKLIQRIRQVMDNANFEINQTNFFKKVKGATEPHAHSRNFLGDGAAQKLPEKFA